MKVSVPMLSLNNSGGSTKEKSHKEKCDSDIHDEVRHSMRDWVAGRKSPGEHKKVMQRAQKALGMNKVEYRK